MINNMGQYLIANSGILLMIILWEVLWKGLGLWRAGRRNQPVWFVLILLLNTLGILPIVYLIVTRPRKVLAKKKS